VAAEGKALNTMFIAQNTDTNQYVVSIAGTDSRSLLDWFLEDFLVTTKVDWPYVADAPTPHPMISLGTYIGLNAIISMAEVQGDNHVHARDYLQSVNAKNVMVTGHSLGGALSPSYALYLADTVAQWSTGDAPVISCLPVAGATPGDGAFSDYYTRRMGATTQRVWNAHDVVPHGFQQDMLSQINTIFEPNVKTPLALKMAVEAVRLLTITKDYKQLMPAVPGFQSSACNAVSTFESAILCNHICAYADYFQISGFQAAVQTILNLSHPFFSDGCN
jgi:hypothetical protein